MDPERTARWTMIFEDRDLGPVFFSQFQGAQCTGFELRRKVITVFRFDLGFS